MIEEPVTEESRVETSQPSSPNESLPIDVSGIPFFSLGDNVTLHLSAQTQDIASIIFVNGSFVSGGDNELIIGNDYINFISGGGGDDIIDGRGGFDLLSGGTGADTFVYTSRYDGGDHIIDFDPDQGDKINLSLIDSDLHDKIVQPLGFAGTKPEAHSVWYFQGKEKTYVFAETDGDLETQEFTLTLDGSHTLQASDFYL